ncbi:CoA transferase [Mesorhizobium sp. M0522]
MCSITGGPESPARVGISMANIATGDTTYAANLEALIQRGKTGKGGVITISVFDVMADWLTVPLLNHEGGKTPTRVGLAPPSIAPYGVFTCNDGKQVLISVQSDRESAKLAYTFLGKPELASDPRFATNVARVTNRAQMDAEVAAGFARRALAEATDAILEAAVALATVNDIEGLSNHPHLRRITVDTPNGPVSSPAPAPIFIN